MPHSTRWLVHKRVVFTRVTGTFTAEELKELTYRLRLITHDGRPPVHHIIDTRFVDKTEFGASALKALSGIRCTNTGVVIMLLKDKGQAFLASIAAQFFGVKMKAARDFRDAMHYLKTYDDDGLSVTTSAR
jgi:hypothetical protein